MPTIRIVSVVSDNLSTILNLIACLFGLCMSYLAVVTIRNPPSNVTSADQKAAVSYVRAASSACLQFCWFFFLLLALYVIRLVGSQFLWPVWTKGFEVIIGDVAYVALAISAYAIWRGRLPARGYLGALCIIGLCVGGIDILLLWAQVSAVPSAPYLHMWSSGLAAIALVWLAAASFARFSDLRLSLACILYAVFMPMLYVSEIRSMSDHPMTVEVDQQAIERLVANQKLRDADLKRVAALTGNDQRNHIATLEATVKSELGASEVRARIARDANQVDRIEKFTVEYHGSKERPATISAEALRRAYSKLREALGRDYALAAYAAMNIGAVLFSVIAVIKLYLVAAFALAIRHYPRTYVDFSTGADPLAGAGKQYVSSETRPVTAFPAGENQTPESVERAFTKRIVTVARLGAATLAVVTFVVLWWQPLITLAAWVLSEVSLRSIAKKLGVGATSESDKAQDPVDRLPATPTLRQRAGQGTATVLQRLSSSPEESPTAPEQPSPPEQPPSAPSSVFVSYSQKDSRWRERLQVHLKPLGREGRIDLWSDQRIQTGQEWRKEIDSALARAKVAILLISADFLASDFIATVELPRLLGAARTRGVQILPVVVSAARYNESPLGRFKSINPPERPLLSMPKKEREAFLVNLSRDVERALKGEVEQ